MKSSETKNKTSLQPKLRFREFVSSKAWEETTIGNIGSFYYGKSAPKWSLEKDAPTPCVRYGELYTKFGPIITQTISRTNINPENLKFSKGGEILVPRVGEKPEDFGKCCCYLPLGNIAIGEMISVFETAQHPLFYTYYFRNMYREFAKVVEGQNVKNLYYAELEPLKIHRPSILEQQKIADCLSSLDELIEAEDQKLEALQRHKKGLMQELFPAEGQTLPKRRFPEFQSAPEWRMDELGKIADIYQSVTISQDQLKSDGEFLVYGANGIIGKLDRYNHENSQIAITCRGSTCGTVTYTEPKSWITGNAMVINFDHNPTRNKRFFYYLLVNTDWRYQITGSGQPQITGTIKKHITVFPELNEQQHIADFLSSIDDSITTQAKKLESLRLHKKGLMQQLFPNAGEVQE
jgi:type I restriction enzyme, S subunit